MNSAALPRFTRFRLALLTAFCITAPAAVAQSEKVIYDFQSNAIGGIFPSSGLIADQSGTLYGTTQQGGSGSCTVGCGTVFKLTPPQFPGASWIEETIYSFQGGPADGELPGGTLLIDDSGSLYGGAVGGKYSQGIIYKLSPPSSPGGTWTETVLVSFPYSQSSDTPNGVLVFDKGFAIYGTTFQGGLYRNGTVFKLAPPNQTGGIWTLSVLYNFAGNPDAQYPSNGLAIDDSGALLGTSLGGGLHGIGAIFKLTPPTTQGAPWTESVLYSFEGPSAHDPQTGNMILESGGSLFGATATASPFGLGAIFRLSPPISSGEPWTYSVLYNFRSGADGCVPAAGPILDGTGALYGTASECGSFNLGTAYKLVPPPENGKFWTEHVLHNFAGGRDATQPNVPLLFLNNSLYGTSAVGGTGSCSLDGLPTGCGTVFQITP